MSDTSREDPSTPNGVEVKDEVDTVDGIEGALVSLADEMSVLIEAGPVDDRIALHDYAVSLVRDRLPVMRPAEVGGQEGADSSAARTKTSGTTGASLVGYGALLIPVGGILLLLFAPLGVTLLGVGVFMVLSGAMFGVLSKLMPSRQGS